MQFQTKWTNELYGWHSPRRLWAPQPALYKTSFEVETPQDTFLDMREWTKGIAVVNGFVLGRYARIGPQQTLYLPAPLQKTGKNDIVIFEHYIAAERVSFSDKAIYSTASFKNQRNL